MPLEAQKPVSWECQSPEIERNDSRGQRKVRNFCLFDVYLSFGVRYSEALKFYEAALEAEPTSSVLWKRKVAVFKAMGDAASAISELNALLSV